MGHHKIIGFTISKQPHNEKPDVFNVGLTIRSWQHGGWHISVWGIGDLTKCYTNENQFSLSFPLSRSLLERNILVTLAEKEILIENDWLGSIPVFYNEKEQVASTLINSVIAQTSAVTMDAEGFNNYLDFGYSALEKTPIAGIKFMRYASRLHFSELGCTYEYGVDPALILSKVATTPAQTLDFLATSVGKKAEEVSGQIILPMSGGFDSRLLGSFISQSHRGRIKAFTYGVSNPQIASKEVVNGRLVAKKLQITWQQIQLDSFHSLYPEWFSLFGCSIHFHGMYQIEFYKKIRQQGVLEASVLSGIIGDAWSGNVQIGPIRTFEEVKKLGYSHGLNFSSSNSSMSKADTGIRNFFTTYGPALFDERLRIIFSMRFKLILLSYLLTVPEYFGYPAWAPFLDLRNVEAILSLPAGERKKERRWQIEYFKAHDLYVEDIPAERLFDSTVDLDNLKTNPLAGVEEKALLAYIKATKLARTTAEYQRLLATGLSTSPSYARVFAWIERLRIRPLLAAFGIKVNYRRKETAYVETLILKPIELTIQKYFKRFT